MTQLDPGAAERWDDGRRDATSHVTMHDRDLRSQSKKYHPSLLLRRGFFMFFPCSAHMCILNKRGKYIILNMILPYEQVNI